MVETEPCLSLRCGWSRWIRRKGSATPPSTPEIALPAVSQASYWERGNPSAATRRNLAVSQVLLFAVLRTGRIWFLCSRNKEPNQRNSRRASEYHQYKLQISQTNHLSLQNRSALETWMLKKKKSLFILNASRSVSPLLQFDRFWFALHHLKHFFQWQWRMEAGYHSVLANIHNLNSSKLCFHKHYGLVFIKIRMWTQCHGHNNVRNASRSYWIQSDFK